MNQSRPFRFGVGRFSAVSPAEWTRAAQQAEDLGYSTFLIPDHLRRLFAPVPALMAAAAATRHLRVGSFVFNNDLRHPAVLAREVATLDLLSEGRFEFGLGAGWARAEYEEAGIPFAPLGVRLRRLAEALTLIKGLFGDGPVMFSGKHYTIEGLEGYPKPVQRPHPPILLGGRGKRMLALAARGANIVSLALQGFPQDLLTQHPDDMLAEQVAVVREVAGNRLGELELNTFVFGVAVADDREQAAAHLASRWGLSHEDVLERSHVLLGPVDAIVEQVQR